MSEHESTTKPMLTSAQYDTIRHFVQYILPAVGTFYYTIAALWGLPYADQVVGTVAALALLLGIVMGASKKSYNNSDARFDGEVEDGIVSFNDAPSALAKNGAVTLKVTDASQ